MARRAAVAAAVLAGIAYVAWVVWLAFATYAGPPDDGDLDRSASELRSIALEASMLDTQAQRSRATEAYRRSSAWQLAHQVSSLIPTLDPAVYPAGLRPRASRLARLARTLETAIAPLQATTVSRAEEQRVRAELTRLAEEANSS